MQQNTMAKKIKMLCFCDITDNTKGVVCAVGEDKDLRTKEMQDKLVEEIVPMFSVDGTMKGYNGDDHMDLIELARHLAYLPNETAEFGDYNFFFEETNLFE